MKRLSWKYMAGLIDGEGCIDMQGSVHKRDGKYYNTPRLRVTLAGDNNKFLLEMMKANYGGHLYTKFRATGNWQTAYTWQLNGRNLRALFQNIVNHMYLKKEQAKLMIWWLDHVAGKHISEQGRKCVRDEMKAMKREPQRLSEWAVRKIEVMISDKPWSKHSDSCLGCKTTDKKHTSLGYCSSCYNRIGRKLNSTDAIVQPA